MVLLRPAPAVPVELLEIFVERPVGPVLETTFQGSDGSVHDDVLVHLAVIVSQRLSKQPDWPVPISAPAAVPDLPSQEKISPPDPVGSGERIRCNQSGDFPRKLRSALLISVHDEHPFVLRALNCKISLAADGRERNLVDQRPTAARDFRSPVGRVVFDDNYLGGPVEAGNAGFDVGCLVPRSNDR